MTSGLLLDRDTAGYAKTPHRRCLGIDADMELVVEATLDDWQNVGYAQCFASKYDATTDNRSWLLSIHAGGAPRFQWSTDGVTSSARDASQVVPFATGRHALLIDVDADNGAGDADLRFYTGPSRNGPWSKLGSTIHPGSPIGFFDATAADLLVGLTQDDQFPLNGSIHYMRLRDNIGHTTAEVDFDAQTPGVAGFIDDVSLPWTLHSGAVIVGDLASGERISTTTETSDSATFTDTETQVASVTAPVVEGRIYRVRFVGGWASDNAGDEVSVRIREDSPSGATLGLHVVDVYRTGSYTASPALETEYVANVTGDKTFVLTGQRLSGSGSVNLDASATSPAYFYVDYVRG